MEIFKVMVPFSDCGDVSKCDAIEYQGKVWLVPEWTEYPALGVKNPVRIVHLGIHGLTPSNFAGCQYMVEVMLLPKAVLEGHAQPVAPIEVVEAPNIEFPIPIGSGSLH